MLSPQTSPMVEDSGTLSGKGISQFEGFNTMKLLYLNFGEKIY